MTTFHTLSREYYECQDCEAQIEHYHDLKHYSKDSGGFCPHCDSDHLVVMQSYIVYQQVYARSDDDALETALEIDEWQTQSGSITQS
jgi:DNA-directed RNA polymerase subunit RPC12/RpoP